MSTPSIEQANAERQKLADDKAARFHKTFAGQATPEQARHTLRDIFAFCLEGDHPGHAAGYETNRTFEIIGRQAVAREISLVLRNQPPRIEP